MHKIPLIPFLALAALYTLACVQVDEPPCPKITIPEGSSECNQFCECEEVDVVGEAFRVTRLEIDEPEAFAEILNLMWETDILNNILNVLFVVDDAIKGEGGVAFESLSVTLGPGWRNPREPLILPPGDDQESADVVDRYCLLEGLSVPLTLLPYHGYQCQVKSEGSSSLYFHSGPKDIPLICAPENDPPNNIPISDLKIRASFNRECTEIVDGFLEGCITVEAADRICMCATAGGCGNEPDPEADTTNLETYCTGVCGTGWFSFGALVHSFGLMPSCLTPAGEEGYRVQGFFDAIGIGDQFNPTASEDCMQD